MALERSGKTPRVEVVHRPTGEQVCPYCGMKMYEVPVTEYPEFEVHLCYACGGCVVYEAAVPSR